MLPVAIALCVATAELASAAPSGPTVPNPIYPAADHMTMLNSSKGVPGTAGPGELWLIDTDDNVKMWVLHTWGTASEQAFTHGMLLAPLLKHFVDVALPAFFESELAQIPISKLPAWLQKVAREAEQKAATPVFEALLGAVYDKEKAFIEKSKSQASVEFVAMATGACASGLFPDCNTTTLVAQIQRMNMIPELVKMTCSMMGAWGKATGPGTELLQLRTLDFGDGPFANYTVVTARHPTDGGVDFVAVGFPGWSGAVTGFSGKVALSEKVWETYTGTGIQPGAYDGEPVALVIRDIMQFSANRAEAIAFAESISRTWSVFLGVGDFETMEFSALGYRKKDLEVFGPENISSVTHEKAFADVVYIDKHPQPSHDNTTMPGLVTKYYGELTGPTTVSNIPRVMGSGDLHVAVYDFANKAAYVSIGLITAEGKYGADDVSGKACNRPYIKFEMDQLLQHTPGQGGAN